MFCQHLFLDALNTTDEELTTSQVASLVGCSVQHTIKSLNKLADDGKIERRMLATKAYLWKKK